MSYLATFFVCGLQIVKCGFYLQLLLRASVLFVSGKYIVWYFQFQDQSELKLTEEDGTARLGFVQLNSGSTSFNTTLNLTGPILLGMGIAAATLFYAYFNAFQG